MEKRITDNGAGWSVLEAGLILVVMLASAFITPFLQGDWLHQAGRLLSPQNPILGEVFLNALCKGALFIGLVGVVVIRKYRLSWCDIGLKKDEEKRWLKVGIGQGVLIFLVVTFLGMIMMIFFPVNIQPQPIAEVLGTARDVRSMVLAIGVASVIAPLSEEIYFRGVLYPALAKLIGRNLALLAASALFGLLHFDLIRFIPITLGGVWLTYLYEKTGSLYTSILAHATWNTIMTLLLFIS